MELSSLVFALGLFSAGVWLIFTISGDFKEKKRQVQQFPPTARKEAPPPARAASIAVAPQSAAVSARQSTTPLRVETVSNSLAGLERVGAADPLQSLSVAVVRETFERFTRER